MHKSAIFVATVFRPKIEQVFFHLFFFKSFPLFWLQSNSLKGCRLISQSARRQSSSLITKRLVDRRLKLEKADMGEAHNRGSTADLVEIDSSDYFLEV